MIKVIFKDGRGIVSTRDFNDDVEPEAVNKYINQNWTGKRTWRMLQNGVGVSFRRLFHKQFEFKEGGQQ